MPLFGFVLPITQNNFYLPVWFLPIDIYPQRLNLAWEMKLCENFIIKWKKYSNRKLLIFSSQGMHRMKRVGQPRTSQAQI